jgi:hypothetical protein
MSDEPQELHGRAAQLFAETHLEELAIDDVAWTATYLDPRDGSKWLMDYPHSEGHGGRFAPATSCRRTVLAGRPPLSPSADTVGWSILCRTFAVGPAAPVSEVELRRPGTVGLPVATLGGWELA